MHLQPHECASIFQVRFSFSECTNHTLIQQHVQYSFLVALSQKIVLQCKIIHSFATRVCRKSDSAQTKLQSPISALECRTARALQYGQCSQLCKPGQVLFWVGGTAHLSAALPGHCSDFVFWGQGALHTSVPHCWGTEFCTVFCTS